MLAAMTRENKLAEVLSGAGKAHHKAFIKTNGEDPEWPSWYATYLLKETDFKNYVAGLNESTLAHLLEMLDHQFKNDTTRQKWSHYYARKLLKIG